jgi:hypothetical protein
VPAHLSIRAARPSHLDAAVTAAGAAAPSERREAIYWRDVSGTGRLGHKGQTDLPLL